MAKVTVKKVDCVSKIKEGIATVKYFENVKSFFDKGFAIVKAIDTGKVGIVDENLNYIIPDKYTEIRYEAIGDFFVLKNEEGKEIIAKWNKQPTNGNAKINIPYYEDLDDGSQEDEGNVIYSEAFEKVEGYSEGMIKAHIQYQKRYAFVDETCKTVFEIEGSCTRDFHNGICRFYEKDYVRFVDKTGAILPIKYKNAADIVSYEVMLSYPQRISFTIFEDDEGNHGILNCDTWEEILKVPYEITNLSNGYVIIANASKRKKYLYHVLLGSSLEILDVNQNVSEGILNLKVEQQKWVGLCIPETKHKNITEKGFGQIMFEVKAVNMRPFKNGFSAVEILPNCWNYINKEGNLLNGEFYNFVEDFNSSGTAIVISRDWQYSHYATIDINGKELTELYEQ